MPQAKCEAMRAMRRRAVRCGAVRHDVAVALRTVLGVAVVTTNLQPSLRLNRRIPVPAKALSTSMPCRAVPCRAVPYHAVPCRAVPWMRYDAEKEIAHVHLVCRFGGLLLLLYIV